MIIRLLLNYCFTVVFLVACGALFSLSFSFFSFVLLHRILACPTSYLASRALCLEVCLFFFLKPWIRNLRTRFRICDEIFSLLQYLLCTVIYNHSCNLAFKIFCQFFLFFIIVFDFCSSDASLFLLFFRKLGSGFVKHVCTYK